MNDVATFPLAPSLSISAAKTQPRGFRRQRAELVRLKAIQDEKAGIAYVTTHRENTIDRITMGSDTNRKGFVVAAGNPFTDTLIGPSSGVWVPGAETYGKVAYFTTDGGTAQSPDGILRTAKLLKVTFPQVTVG